MMRYYSDMRRLLTGKGFTEFDDFVDGRVFLCQGSPALLS